MPGPTTAVLILSATWLPYDQRWAIVDGAASLTWRLILIRREGHQEPCSEVGSQSPTKHRRISHLLNSALCTVSL